MAQILILAEAADRLARSFSARCRRRGVAVRRTAPWSFWSALSPELTVAQDGRTASNLHGRALFSRLGALPEAGLERWAEADRGYASAEAQAAFLAHLAAHPNAVNRPLPHDFTGLGLRFPEQLELARASGLRTPAWMFTSELSEATRFLLEHGAATLYRPRCEDVFDFRVAAPGRLPVRDGRLLSAAMLVEGRRGAPVASTWAAGRLVHADARTGRALPAPAAENALRSFFEASGLRFGQAIGVLGADGYSFYGAVGTPQLRFYAEAADAVHDALIDSLTEAA